MSKVEKCVTRQPTVQLYGQPATTLVQEEGGAKVVCSGPITVRAYWDADVAMLGRLTSMELDADSTQMTTTARGRKLVERGKAEDGRQAEYRRRTSRTAASVRPASHKSPKREKAVQTMLYPIPFKHSSLTRRGRSVMTAIHLARWSPR